MPIVVREALHKRNQSQPSMSAMISFALALAAASVAEQMAPARQGMLQCQLPDTLFKTCASLSKVVQSGPATYRIETKMLVDPNGPVVVTINSAVHVSGHEICDKNDPADLSAATWTSAGKPLASAGAARYLALIRRSLAAVQGKEVCTRIESEESGVKVLGRIGGKRVPALDYDMMWVDPKDGWTVAR
jgi:hypothetical protein